LIRVIYVPENFRERLGKRGIAPTQGGNAGSVVSAAGKNERHALNNPVAVMMGLVLVQTQFTTLAKYPAILVSVALVSILPKNHSTYKAPPWGEAFFCAKVPGIHPPFRSRSPGPHQQQRRFAQETIWDNRFEPWAGGIREESKREKNGAGEVRVQLGSKIERGPERDGHPPYCGKRDERAD
jgi:hypothetical protein